MTREEELIRKIDNIHLRGRRALETARVFMEFNGNISDIDLAEELIKGYLSIDDSKWNAKCVSVYIHRISNIYG